MKYKKIIEKLGRREEYILDAGEDPAANAALVRGKGCVPLDAPKKSAKEATSEKAD
jgi:hypothetical protein